MYSISLTIPSLNRFDLNTLQAVDTRDKIIKSDIVNTNILIAKPRREFDYFGDENTPMAVKYQNLLHDMYEIKVSEEDAGLLLDIEKNYEKTVKRVFPEFKESSAADTELLAKLILKYASPIHDIRTLSRDKWKNQNEPEFCLRLANDDIFENDIENAKDCIIEEFAETVAKRQEYIAAAEKTQAEYAEALRIRRKKIDCVTYAASCPETKEVFTDLTLAELQETLNANVLAGNSLDITCSHSDNVVSISKDETPGWYETVLETDIYLDVEKQFHLNFDDIPLEDEEKSMDEE